MACPFKGTSKTHPTLHLFGLFVIFLSSLLLTLLALDVFTIPYLTPFAHGLRTILSSLLPLLAPVFLGVFLKFCSIPSFPKKKLWICISFSWFIQQLQRIITDGSQLVKEFKYDASGRTGLDGVQMEFCGLEECGSYWLEYGLMFVVVVCQLRGWKWEGGVVDRWVDKVVARSWEEEREKKGGDADIMENGIVGKEESVDVKEEKEWIDEKEVVVIVEEVKS